MTAASIRLRTSRRASTLTVTGFEEPTPAAAANPYGQRAPSETMPMAARMARASPKPAYRDVTSLSTFSVPTELPMSL